MEAEFDVERSAHLQQQAILLMLAQELNIAPPSRPPREFQVEVIGHAVFPEEVSSSLRICMVQRTGNGKSAVVLGTVLMLGGVGLCISPLHSYSNFRSRMRVV